MRLPKEKIIFVVDLLPVGRMPGRGMIDFYPLEAEDSIKKILAMDWERLIPGHPDSGGRLGTKKDVEQQLAILQDASAEMKKLGHAGKCWDDSRKGVQAAEVRHSAGLRGESAIHRPALLRPVGPRHLIRKPRIKNGPLARAARIGYAYPPGVTRVRRREFITLMGSAVAVSPLATHAQSPMPVIGFVSARSPGESASVLAAFRKGLS